MGAVTTIEVPTGELDAAWQEITIARESAGPARILAPPGTPCLPPPLCLQNGKSIMLSCRWSRLGGSEHADCTGGEGRPFCHRPGSRVQSTWFGCTGDSQTGGRSQAGGLHILLLLLLPCAAWMSGWHTDHLQMLGEMSEDDGWLVTAKKPDLRVLYKHQKGTTCKAAAAFTMHLWALLPIPPR